MPIAMLPTHALRASRARKSYEPDQEALDAHLRWAAAFGNSQSILRLLDIGADALARGARGSTALHFAAAWNHAECVRLLLPSSRPKALDGAGASAGDLARLKGHAECAKLIEEEILRRGAAAEARRIACSLREAPFSPSGRRAWL